jgi:hypothetical protein
MNTRRRQEHIPTLGPSEFGCCVAANSSIRRGALRSPIRYDPSYAVLKGRRAAFLRNPDPPVTFHFTSQHASWLNQVKVLDPRPQAPSARELQR